MEGIGFITLEKVTEREAAELLQGSAPAAPAQVTSAVSAPVRQSSGRKELVIKKCSIIEVEAEVIVKAANPQLRHGGGVDGVIRNACGAAAINAETDAIVKTLPNGTLSPGQVVSTGSYQLARKYKKIFHTAAPFIRPGQQPTSAEEEHLRQCYYNSLSLAGGDGFSSIAFPLLGIGLYNFDERKGMKIAVDEISSFFEKHPNTSLNKVYIVALGPRIVKGVQRLTGGQSVSSLDAPSMRP